MRKRNLWIILAAVAVIAAVFVVALALHRSTVAPSLLPEDLPNQVQAYLYITVGGEPYQLLPLEGEGQFSLTQGDTGMVNVVHVTPTSVWMADSTCDNQDCVEQGVVSLDSMDGRVLGNMIICLPHQVTLELYTAEEITALVRQQEGTP